MTAFSNHSPPYADSPFASVGQSILNRAASFPVSGEECGALPRRRYARKALKYGSDEDRRWVSERLRMEDESRLTQAIRRVKAGGDPKLRALRQRLERAGENQDSTPP